MSRRRPYHARALGLILASALVTVACGSTVPTTGTQVVGSGGGMAASELAADGMSAPVVDAPIGDETRAPATSTGARATSSGGPAIPGIGNGGGRPRSDGGKVGVPIGPGVSAKEIAL